LGRRVTLHPSDTGYILRSSGFNLKSGSAQGKFLCAIVSSPEHQLLYSAAIALLSFLGQPIKGASTVCIAAPEPLSHSTDRNYMNELTSKLTDAILLISDDHDRIVPAHANRVPNLNNDSFGTVGQLGNW
jgi:hypothetical protein